MFSVEERIGKAIDKAPSHKTSISRHVKRPTPTRVVERASRADFGLWSLGFFWSLELGAWSFPPSRDFVCKFLPNALKTREHVAVVQRIPAIPQTRKEM